MANIAQIVNVLQSMILTNAEGGMVLTPTYHVFRMYNVHQDATYIPLDITCNTIDVRGDRQVPLLSATASKDAEGKVHISLSNVDVEHTCTVTINLEGISAKKATGEILTATNLSDHNTFEQPELVVPTSFDGAKVKKDILTVTLPAKSIVTLELQ